MKRFTLLLIFTSMAIFAFAQAPYTGGQADGYASIEGHAGIIVDPPEPLEYIFVYPSAVKQGDEIGIDVFQIKNDLEIRLVDELGQIIFQDIYSGFSGDKRIKLVTDKLGAAVYWIEILRDGEKTVRSVIILNE